MSNINDFDGEGKRQTRFTNLYLQKRVLTQGRCLSNEAFRLYTAMLSFRNNGTGRTYPAREKLIERSGLSERLYRVAREELIRFHWIEIQRHMNKSNDYIISCPVVWIDKQAGVKAEDQTCPTQAEAIAWRRRLREKRSLKEPRRRFDLQRTTALPHASGYKADPAWYDNDPDAWPDQVGDEEFEDVPF